MQANPPVDPPRAVARAAAPKRRARPWALWLIVAICAIPFPLAAALYFAPTWFVGVPALAALADGLTPDAKSNYGTIVEPQRAAPALGAVLLDGTPFELSSLRGRWVMLSLGHDSCDEACVRRLYVMRQLRASTGKDQLRIERVLLVDGNQPIGPRVLTAYEGTRIARVDPVRLPAWLPAAAPGRTLDEHLYLIDPLGNLMMRWPANADPVRVRKDLVRLLFASHIG